MANDQVAPVTGSPGAPATTPGVEGQATMTETQTESKVFPPFDASTFASQLFWFAICFLIFYWVIAKVAIPRIGGILQSRRGRINGDLADAERMKKQSEEAGLAYEKALADARANASKIADGARDASRAASAKQRAEVEAALAARLSSAETQIAGIKTQALAEVGGIAGEATDAVVRVLTGLEATAGEVRDAVAAALSERKVNA